MGNPLFSAQPSAPTWESIKTAFLETGDPDRVLTERAALVDSVVLEAWHQWIAPQAPAGVALLAVGGYGRRQQFPYSDVDLLILFGSDKAAIESKALLSPFLQQLWDSSLRVSQSVRTVEECAAVHDQNVELNISLLDLRRLSGDGELTAQLETRMGRFLAAQRPALVRNLARLTSERHVKYGHTIHHLEPNIKETPGGLRDYQLLCWLRQLRAADGTRLPQPAPPSELDDARRFLFRLRCHLHYRSGRDQNALSFDAQESIAGGEDAAAQWMREYFRHARSIHRAAARHLEESESSSPSLLRQFRDWRQRLSNAEFTVLNDRVLFRAPGQLDHDPLMVLRLYEFVARHGVRPSADSDQRISARIGGIAAYYAQPRPAWDHLCVILDQPYATLALRSMHESGVLEALFPELMDIDSLVIRDFYHRYTVDEHTLVAIRTLEELPKAKGPHASFATLYTELDSRAVLTFALLFHDAGKGAPEEGHVDASVRVAAGAMRRIMMPEADQTMVNFLIGAHLVLSATMNSRDLDDAATVRSVAAQVGTVERLKALTLLTYADISAVNPAAMTPWRAEQLFRLYRLTYRELTRELESDRVRSRPQDSPEKARFLEGLPSRYLRTHDEAQIEGHFQLSRRLAERWVVIDIRKAAAGYQLTLITRDRPGLLAPIAGTLAGFGMNILKAEAFANAHGEVLDTFLFADPLRTLDLNPEETVRLEVTLERVVLGKADVRTLIKNRPVPSLPSRAARLSPAVEIDSEASATSTLIHIVAEDRPGLLYDLANTMSAAGCSIDVVLIDTEAHKAIDVFYVSGAQGKLAPEDAMELRKQLLTACRG